VGSDHVVLLEQLSVLLQLCPYALDDLIEELFLDFIKEAHVSLDFAAIVADRVHLNDLFGAEKEDFVHIKEQKVVIAVHH